MTETASAIRIELESMFDPKALAINERHGDSHSVNLTKLRTVAKRIKTDQGLATELWQSGDSNSRLLALLICAPKAFSNNELDAMLRAANTPKEQDWLINYVVKKSPHKEELRTLWLSDEDPVVASAGWALTTERVGKNPAGLDLHGLLDTIEVSMQAAPSRLQWAMNETLANIGIFHAQLRDRAMDIGERLEVLKDYPTPPNCTSPFAPIWISEVVRRNQEKEALQSKA